MCYLRQPEQVHQQDGKDSVPNVFNEYCVKGVILVTEMGHTICLCETEIQRQRV